MQTIKKINIRESDSEIKNGTKGTLNTTVSFKLVNAKTNRIAKPQSDRMTGI
jgi:hypothetical protein